MRVIFLFQLKFKIKILVTIFDEYKNYNIITLRIALIINVGKEKNDFFCDSVQKRTTLP